MFRVVELFRNKPHILAVFFPSYCIKKNLTYPGMSGLLSLPNEKYPG